MMVTVFVVDDVLPNSPLEVAKLVKSLEQERQQGNVVLMAGDMMYSQLEAEAVEAAAKWVRENWAPTINVSFTSLLEPEEPIRKFKFTEQESWRKRGKRKRTPEQMTESGPRWLKQTSFYDPTDADNPHKGNCGEAAIASLLGVPIPEKFGPSGKSEDYWDDFDAFVESHGYEMMLIPKHIPHNGMYLASGPSKRGCSHMVVMHDGHLVHDPHPSNDGIQYVERMYVLVPHDPKVE